jgi:hypothetical protein
LFHSVDIDTKDSVRVKFKIELGQEEETSSNNEKMSFTPILLQGSNYWRSAQVVDPDYCSLKFTFDKFTEGSISRLLFIKKKFSPEINKKFLERVIRKRKILAEEQISESDLDKMFGNHLFKFFYKVMNNYSRSHTRLSQELSLYLGLTDHLHSNSDQEPGSRGAL